MAGGWDTLRLVSAHSASSSAPTTVSSWRMLAPSQAVPGPSGVLRAISTRSASSRIDPSSSLTNAVPRSKPKVTMATRHPSFSAPTTFSTGIRTLVEEHPLNSLAGDVRMGRTSMPGESIGMIIQVMPRCLGASGSVRASSSQ